LSFFTNITAYKNSHEYIWTIDDYATENFCQLVKNDSFDVFSLALVEDDEERPSLQQRTPNANTQTTLTQAMKIIPEEDENPESSPTE
jgi:hypothetical protein